MQKKQWIVFTLIVSAFGAFAYKYFDQAIPFIKIPITMNYDQACSKAKEIVAKHNWDFKNYQIFAKYTESARLQAFVELEGGGKQAFIEMIEKDYFQPYAWHVRFFKEKEVQEMIIAFTPDGRAYEFAIKLPETLAGAALLKEQAHKIALDGACDWGVDLSPYELVESNREELVSGRVDYLFVYQRSDVALKKGLYRIKLKVSGDLLSEVQREVKIPDEFNRRYEQMFSLNNTIASFARNIGFILYFFIFGIFIFIFFFHRKNGFLWRSNFKFLGLLILLFILSSANDWSLIWNCYPTHMPMLAFILQQIAVMALNILFLLVLIGCTILLAEVAGRLMFKKHIQFFKLWDRSVLATHQIFEQTIIGYGFAVVMLGYAVGFSLWTQTLGWWVPLSNLMDPNILATKVPSFSPISNAFRAGFMEEFLCRALPLAGIALLARNSKQKSYWLVAMFVIQAIIFGALHANYPQQPAYYRIVELIFHSTGFGLLYLYFGLLPGIISHFVFDAFLMSLPIFVSTLMIQKILTVIMMLIPLILVFFAWLLQKCKLKNVSPTDLNQSLEIDQSPMQKADIKRKEADAISNRMRLAGYAFGIIGLFLWSQSKEFEIQTSKITQNMSEVERIARQAVIDNFGPLGEEWKTSRKYESPRNSLGSKFIWQTFGNDMYQKLQGNYLLSPAYTIKFSKFVGPVEDRSEMFEVVIQADGTVARLKHAFPEFWQGSDLSENQAQDLAYDWILKIYKIDRMDMQLVSSQSVKHQDRRDWCIILKDLKNYTCDQGQARIQIQLCGDQLGKIMRFINPTEQWQRAEQSRMTQNHLLKAALSMVSILFCALFLLIAIRKFGVSVAYFIPFLTITAALIIFGFLVLANSWFEILYCFSTARSLSYQIFDMIGNSFIELLVKGAMLSLLILSSIFFGVRVRSKNKYLALLLGTALGVGIFGIILFCKNFEPMLEPNSSFNGFSLNFISTFGFFTTFVSQTMSAVVTMMAICALAQYFIYNRCLQILIFIGAGVVLSPSAQLSDVFAWIISGIIFGLLWYFVYKYFLTKDSDLIWIIMAVGQIMSIIPSVYYQAYPDIISHVAFSSLAVFGIVAWMYAKI